MTSGIRDRTRELLRVQLAEAILAVFLERGYSSVTVEDAAREVGISRATFFRYFRSKEDVVVASVDDTRIDYAKGISAIPDDADVTGWGLVRAAIEPVVLTAMSDPSALRARLNLISGEPSLRARLRERRSENVDVLTTALAQRTGDGFYARILAVAGLAAVDIAWERWASDENEDFRMVIDSAFERLGWAGQSGTESPRHT
ncbi:TetR family transcriptional regulator [Arthrobacter sp.]|uniref:TetR family transcriptional regulator n=1 Tax=Arthrobacter sp. TaxID=1667 RepID=UPI0028111267|nr:TetR family transcriptional regulator [Arthrobacter sp.]